ncbi:MAG: hypothetical protein IJT25_01680 [Clostridia bacterium]|nr:hypothetical protein [Clostridia bacterium]
MIFKKLLNKPTSNKNKIKITTFEKGINFKKDENILPLSYAYTTFNYDNKDGALKTGLGIDEFIDHLPLGSSFKSKLLNELNNIGSIKAVYVAKKYNNQLDARQDKLVLLKEDNTMCYLPLYETETLPETILEDIENLTLNSVPVAVNYRLNGEDCTIFCGSKDAMFVLGLGEDVITVADAPFITSMAIHYERLFATTGGEQSKIWFSDDLDPTNFSVGLDEAGFIEMLDERGALKKVISFNDYIYIFRDYGITRLSAYADQSSFNVSQLFVSSGKIYPSTVCVCGDEIIFLASDGLYSFNGINTTKILDNISLGFTTKSNENAMATYFENKYYLACNFDFKDELFEGENTAINNALIEVDLIKRNAVFLRGADVSYISTCLSENLEGVLVCAKKYGEENYNLGVVSLSGSIFSSPTFKVWQTPLTDFGSGGSKKIIDKILVSTTNPLNIKILNEKGESKTLLFKGSLKAQNIKTKFAGEKLSFRFETNNKTARVSSPQVKINFGTRGTF